MMCGHVVPASSETKSWRRNRLYAKPDGQTPLNASIMAKDKIRPAALKVGIRLELGQRFGFHNFRHSLATFLINKGRDVKTIQGLLRHTKSSTLHLDSQALDESKLAGKEISPSQLQAVRRRRTNLKTLIGVGRQSCEACYRRPDRHRASRSGAK